MSSRLLGIAALVGLVALAAFGLTRRLGASVPGAPRSVSQSALSATAVQRAEAAITRMDLEEASKILESSSGAEAGRARARLAIYRADCEGAAALLGTSQSSSAPGARELSAFAERCAGATVGGHVVEDRARGVWIRFQDRADEVLASLLFDAVVRARLVIEADLGASLPRPLRIDLVRDLFSLAAVSGLPLEAAETTGTVAVARWGRVTMISPRAMLRGYPWQDTMAHEITHLVLARATADRAPLWLQEGVAKREETRWRAPRPFDRDPEPALTAYRAQESGNSVGVDRLGPSIAMLPSADAAGIAFAEVTSFVEYWLERNGAAALPALLRDVRFAPDTERALTSTSGLGLRDWQVLWRHALEERFAKTPTTRGPALGDAGTNPRRVAQVQRLVELLFVGGFPGEARLRGAPDLEGAPHAAALSFLVARAAYAAGDDDAALLLRPLTELDGAHGGFLALRGRSVRQGTPAVEVSVGDPASVSTPVPTPGSKADAEAYAAHALALDPLLPEVACGGEPWPLGKGRLTPTGQGPSQPARNKLCEHTRSLPVRGAE